ncbi:putative amidoligase enzyme-domain-containing protein [Whalleya microplaca]|nr:putative amidoligase enzyme-domain-containing protein [Whalleya microplaca]
MGLFSKKASRSGGGAPAAPPPPPPPPVPVHQTPASTVLATSQPALPQVPRGTIGIGIETEFKLRYRDTKRVNSSFRTFARSMAFEHNQAVQATIPRMESLVQNLVDGPPHMSWKLVHDPTCETYASPWGIEMVSPIFRLTRGSGWRTAIQATWKFIQTNYVVMADTTCSTHVHMSIAENYSASQLKRLAQAIIYFEPAFEALLPSDRRGNEYARSNWIDNHHFGYKRLSRADSIALLERCYTIDEVINLMNPEGSRYFGWNFQAIKKYKTVEFRRGAASTSVDDVFLWVEVATSFLRASLKMTSADSLRGFAPNMGGFRSFLAQGINDIPGIGDSRYLQRLFAGRKPDERLEPKPVGKLSPEKRKKLEKKIYLDSRSNPMLDNMGVAQSSGII